MGEELILVDEQRKWFVRIESIPSEGASMVIEIKTKDLEHYINLADNVVAGFERTSLILQKVPLWIKYS